MFPDLINEIEKVIHAPDIDQYAGFFVKGGFVWDGMPLKYGLKNNKITLLHKGRMRYPIIDDLGCEIMGEIEGHYQPVPIHDNHKIGQLKTKIDHYAFVDLSDWDKRHKKYAVWEAYMLHHKAYPTEPSRIRQFLKAIFRRLPARPLFAFLHSYILKLGFFDGRAGFGFARTRYRYYKMVREQANALGTHIF
ncbi:MAG: hypothetical protein ACPG05_05670 [Bdellovibrionales bacterium]